MNHRLVNRLFFSLVVLKIMSVEEWDQWWIGGREGLGLASVNESKDVDQIQAIAFLDASLSLLDSSFGSERSFTEPSGPLLNVSAY